MLTFEWDSEKEKSNIEKHNGITFKMAAQVFFDPHVLIKYDAKHSTVSEERWKAIGMAGDILFVVFTERGNDTIRIISARPAQTEEINEYFSNYDT